MNSQIEKKERNGENVWRAVSRQRCANTHTYICFSSQKEIYFFFGEVLGKAGRAALSWSKLVKSARVALSRSSPGAARRRDTPRNGCELSRTSVVAW